jgi:PAP2 superfamily
MRTRHTLAALLALTTLACGGDTLTTSTSQIDDPADPARESAAARWMALTRAVVGRRETTSPLGVARTFALVAVAQYDALVTVHQVRSHGGQPSTAGATSGAAAAVLVALYPLEKAAIDSQLAADVAYYATRPSERGADFAAGSALGRATADTALVRAANDRSNAVWTGSIPAGAGKWVNAPAPAQPVSPLWGQTRPWLLTSGDQFRPAAPPAFGSPAFQVAVAETRQLTDGRTPEQLIVAQYWQFASGPGGPMGHFTEVLTQLASQQQLTEEETARAFAVMHMAMMDASIGCWDAKYTYWYVRPFQADPLITTPVGRPNFPSYPSAHSCLSAAAAGVIAGLFPSAGLEMQRQVDEAGVARIYAGLHFRFDVDAGQRLGASVAALALAHAPGAHVAIPLK